MTFWLGIIVTAWICGGILVGTLWAKRDRIVDLRDQEVQDWVRRATSQSPPPTETQRRSSDASTIRRQG